MVTQQQKSQALDYIANLIEQTNIYQIKQATNRSLLAQEISFDKTKIAITIANFYTPINEFQEQYRENRRNGIFTAPLLYKDGKTSFVRLVDNSTWRADQSLKKYSEQQINEMLHLRGIEKKVEQLFGQSLTYYQPPTDRLAQGLRTFTLHPVDLDYSHIPIADPRYDFVENRQAIDYKLPLDKGYLTPAAGFDYNPNDPLKCAKLTAMEPLTERDFGPSMADIHAELHKLAQRAYPDLDPDEAYEKYCNAEKDNE